MKRKFFSAYHDTQVALMHQTQKRRKTDTDRQITTSQTYQEDSSGDENQMFVSNHSESEDSESQNAIVED